MQKTQEIRDTINNMSSILRNQRKAVEYLVETNTTTQSFLDKFSAELTSLQNQINIMNKRIDKLWDAHMEGYTK